MMKRRVLVIVLAALGMAFLLGGFIVMSQDFGSCPGEMQGTQLPCDHAYVVHGTNVWMRPLYTGLIVVSLVCLISAAVVALYMRFITPSLR